MTDSSDAEWQKPPWLKQRLNERAAEQPVQFTAAWAEDYQREFTAELNRILAVRHRFEQINSVVTEMHAWGILMLRELAHMRYESDALIRRIAVDMVKGSFMQQQEVAKLTGFSRNTISAWVRKESRKDLRNPEPPDDMTDPGQIYH